MPEKKSFAPPPKVDADDKQEKSAVGVKGSNRYKKGKASTKRNPLLPEKLYTKPLKVKGIQIFEADIGVLDKEVFEAQNLVNLSITSTDLWTLDSRIGRLQQLKLLFLNDNELKTLPNSFGLLVNLEKIDLSSNQLESLPISFGNCTRAVEIKLNDNDLRLLPNQFGDLASCRTLHLHDNQIESLPYSFGNMKSLETLNIWRNNLKTFPVTFGGLTNLITLMAQENKIDTLPDSFGDLRSLFRVNFKTNKLQALPKSCDSLENLSFIYLNDNPIRRLPEFSQGETCVDLDKKQAHIVPQNATYRVRFGEEEIAPAQPTKPAHSQPRKQAISSYRVTPKEKKEPQKAPQVIEEVSLSNKKPDANAIATAVMDGNREGPHQRGVEHSPVTGAAEWIEVSIDDLLQDNEKKEEEEEKKPHPYYGNLIHREYKPRAPSNSASPKSRSPSSRTQPVRRPKHKECRKVFDQVRPEGRDWINLAEFERACRQLNLKPGDYTASFKRLDEDGNNQLEFVEFCKILILGK